MNKKFKKIDFKLAIGAGGSFYLARWFCQERQKLRVIYKYQKR